VNDTYSCEPLVFKYMSIVMTETWFVCSRILAKTGKRTSHSELQ
jgi:hypothetical protein